MLDQLERAVTAEHEAAHAVCYLALGHGIRIVSVEDGVTESVHCGQPLDVRQSAVVAIAGVVIEDRHRHQSLDDRIAEALEWAESGEDVDELGDLALFATKPRWLADPQLSYEWAQEILEDHAEVHREIIDALLAKPEGEQTLTGDELATLPAAATLLGMDSMCGVCAG